MYVKTSNFIIYMGLTAVVGFVVSLFAGNMGAEQGLTGGDISKASRYTNQKEDPAFTVIEEKLRNDEEFFNNTKGAMSFLQNRMEVLSELSEETLAACDGISEFEPLMEDLKSLNAKSFNTASAMENAGRCLDKIADGKNAPEYEVYSNMAYIGLGKVEAGMNFGRKFIDAVRDFFIRKPVGEYQKLTDLASVWAVYCTEDAYINSSEEDLAFWRSYGSPEQQKSDALDLAFTIWGGAGGAQGTPNDTTKNEKKEDYNNPNNNKPSYIIRDINLFGNSALGEYINSLASASKNIMAAGVSVELGNVAEEQLKNSVEHYFKNSVSEQVKNSVSEQVKNSVSEQVKNSVSEQVRNSVSEQVKNSVQEAMRAAFPGEIEGGLKSYIQLVEW